MLIEKAKDKRDLIEKLNLIIKKCKDEKQLEELRNIILYALSGALCNIEQEELIEKIDEKVGEDMSTLVERLTAENRRILNQGIAQGVKKRNEKRNEKTKDRKRKKNVIYEF